MGKKAAGQGPIAAILGLCLLLLVGFVWDGLKNGLGSAKSASNECVGATPVSESHPREAPSNTWPHYELLGICSRLPANKTATYLWKYVLVDRMRQAMVAHSSVNEASTDDSESMTLELISLLRPQMLRQGVRVRPLLSHWGSLVEKLHQRLINKSASPVRVLIVGGSNLRGSSCDVVAKAAYGTDSSTPSDACSWLGRLQFILDEFFRQEDAIQIDELVVPDVTTEFFTTLLQHGLLYGNTTMPDLIVHANSRQDNYRPDRDRTVLEDVKWQEHQRRIHQDFVRAALASQPCRSDNHGPVVLFLDDDILDSSHESLLAGSITSRAIQQLAEYYPAVGLVSSAQVLRRWVMAGANASPLVDTASLLTVLFSSLQLTIDYCNEAAAPSVDNQFYSDSVWKRVETVPPPLLDGQLSLETVTQSWQAAEQQWAERRAFLCENGRRIKRQRCVHVIVAGLTQDSWLVDNDSVGWEVAEGGILRATQPRASLLMKVPVSETIVDRVYLFVVREDVQSGPNVQLQVEIQVAGTKNATTVATITATHNSAARVALPEVIGIDPPVLPESVLEIRLHLIQGDSVDVMALLVCNSQET